jgi:methylphosphotriester-DNA--protein-cysteine methyltransferase
MKRETRIFFADEAEALTAGYRPCAHCMGEQYLIWKKITGSISRI